MCITDTKRKEMMKELHKLITKDIFNCLSEEESERLDVLREKLKISDEAYERMKGTITGGALHEEILEVRKKSKRILIALRYAAVLVLPLLVAAYILLSKEDKKILVVANQERVEEKLNVPVRKQPELILGDGAVVKLSREEDRQEVTPHAINTGKELVYVKNAVKEQVKQVEYNTIKVPKNGEYHVTLADGTRVWFSEETELKFPVEFSGDNREVFLIKGEAYFQVERDEMYPFIVHTINGDVRVLGTEFNVKSLPNHSVVTTLVKGKVQINRGTSKVILKPNQQAVVGDLADAISILNVDVEDVICWKDNLFFFRDVELETIMNKLAGWYGFTVFYENPETKYEKYFVRIDKYAEVDKILEVLAEISNVKFKMNGKTVSVYK